MMAMSRPAPYTGSVVEPFTDTLSLLPRSQCYVARTSFVGTGPRLRAVLCADRLRPVPLALRTAAPNKTRRRLGVRGRRFFHPRRRCLVWRPDRIGNPPFDIARSRLVARWTLSHPSEHALHLHKVVLRAKGQDKRVGEREVLREVLEDWWQVFKCLKRRSRKNNNTRL